MRSAFAVFTPIVLSTSLYAQSWQSIDSFPGISRDDAVAEVINGNAYFGTGFGTGFVVLNDWWKRDMESASWYQMTSLPSLPRQYAASCVHNEKVFVGGGILNTGFCTDEIWSYNSTTDTWYLETIFPGGVRQAPVMVCLYDKLYMGFGRVSTQYYNDWWEYDLYAKTWKQLVTPPVSPRYDMEAVECAGEVYMGLGKDAVQGYTDWWAFNPVTMQWQQKTSYPGVSCAYTSAANSGEWIFLYGGTNFSNVFSDEYYFYHVKTNTWVLQNSIPGYPRKGGVLVSYDASLFYISGIDSTNFRTPQVWKSDETDTVLQDIVFYPNPSTDWLCMNAHISFSAEYVLEIYSMLTGQHVFSAVSEYFNSCFPVQKLVPGFYMARLRNGSTYFNSFRFLKQ